MKTFGNITSSPPAGIEGVVSVAWLCDSQAELDDAFLFDFSPLTIELIEPRGSIVHRALALHPSPEPHRSPEPSRGDR